MIPKLSLLSTLTLICLTLSGQLLAATTAEELAGLARAQEALQREQDQHETSMRLLRANNANPGSIITLQAQMDATRLKLLELGEKELRLRRSLSRSGTGGVDEDNTAPEALEVQRLKVLLTRYYAEEERIKARGTVTVTPDSADRVETARSYDANQVLLSGAESISAINDITSRLESDSVVTSQRREIDVIYHVEVRAKGALVSSKSHSLKALGRSQYVSKVSLGAGQAIITVKTNKWTALLPEDEQGDYLVILFTPFDQPPELHLLPVQSLRDTGWKELPAWLPYIGTAQGS